ncbi:phosphatase [Murdochiella vaginalis]|uniref:phosphatase n=1 Tax=Murdochiella vaginalis TaxID=1852373 RepID=UPI0008FE208C|nr:phosphatase [Murdochiella vaginalis]
MHALMDLHTHTLASVHAYSTLTENAREAKKNGLEILGMSDHGYGMPNTTLPVYWMNLSVIPPYLEGVRILRGIEMNICDMQGSLFEEDVIGKTDYIIASLHGNIFDFGKTRATDFTSVYVKAMERYPEINILGHPDDARYPIDYEVLVKACKEHNVAMEVNCSSLDPNSFRKNAEENQRCYIPLCKAYEVPIIIDSDAHMSTAVGDFTAAEELLKELDFPEELIINTSWDKLENLLGYTI